MTDEQIREMATAALAGISEVRKGSVYGARRGIVAGFQSREQPTVCFRREGGMVRIETWFPSGGRKVRVYPLPPDLQKLAGKMLDNL